MENIKATIQLHKKWLNKAGGKQLDIKDGDLIFITSNLHQFFSVMSIYPILIQLNNSIKY